MLRLPKLTSVSGVRARSVLLVEGDFKHDCSIAKVQRKLNAHRIVNTPRAVLLGCRRFCSCESTQAQQKSTDFKQQRATGSTAITWNQQNSTNFNKLWNLVRDQGVGGSNPLSPTKYFAINQLRCL